jgi:IMP dehydrogenase/GMP reductase
MKKALTFDDVCLAPQYDNIGSRMDGSIDLTTHLTRKTKIKIPILASNMDTVIDDPLACVLIRKGSMPFFHRFASEDTLKRWANTYSESCYMSIGVNVEDKLLKYYRKVGVRGIVIDIAHAHSLKVRELLTHLKTKFPELERVVGNVCTASGYIDLVNWGADAVKVGVGPGCFSSETKVLMADGSYKNINKIKSGEYVINQHGNPVRVKGVQSKGYRKVVKLSHPSWYKETYVTPEHNFYILDCTSLSNQTIQTRGFSALMNIQEKTSPKKERLCWKEIGTLYREKQVLLTPYNISMDFLNTGFSIDLSNYSKKCQISNNSFTTNSNIQNNSFIRDTYDVGYLIGMFLGDGSAKLTTNKNNDCESGSVSWYLNLKEDQKIIEKLQHTINNVFGRDSSFSTKNNNVGVVTLYSKSACKWFIDIQANNNNEKSLKNQYITKNLKYLLGIFDGLVDSDGHIEKNGRICFHNTSESLIELFTLLCRFLNYTYSISEKTKSTGTLKNCNIENLKNAYVVRTHTSKRHNEEYSYTKFRKYSPVEVEMEVWDIEVDCSSHSFIADGVIVHNSACTTRITTGFGVPQFTAIQECAEQAKKLSIPIIADGGIRGSADIVKALAAGATTVMIGKMFALTMDSAASKYLDLGGKYLESDKIPSASVTTDQYYAKYRGQASEDFQKEFKGGLKEGTVAEGVDFVAPIPNNWYSEHLIEHLLGGIRSGMTYGGARTVGEIQRKAEFREVNPSYIIESNPRRT